MVTSNSLFVDTSGWAYLIDSDESLHQPVRNVYEQALRQRRLLVTTNYLLAELVPLVTNRSRISRQQIFAFVDTLKISTRVEIIHVDPTLDDEAWSLLKARGDKLWSLADASSFVIMSKYGMKEALTTDHHFTQAGFIRLPAS